MAEAGRVKHHIKHAITDSKNTILIVGYAEPNSIAGKLRSGTKEVKMFGLPYPVRANIQMVESYSAHADYEEMIRYLDCQNPRLIRAMI